MAGDKARCDLCGKEVGTASLWKRVGFVPGSRANQVCGACYKDKLPRDERLRFAKPAPRAAKRKADEAEEPWKPEAPQPPDELRF
jgi:ribosome-binding protein aMBF1 (putative translation factor)